MSQRALVRKRYICQIMRELRAEAAVLSGGCKQRAKNDGFCGTSHSFSFSEKSLKCQTLFFEMPASVSKINRGDRVPEAAAQKT